MATAAPAKAPQAGAPSAPKRNNAARVFGYDVFISFALGPPPRGTHSYASDLARRLRERDFTVFFSEDEVSPGEQLDSTLLKALLRSRTLVVIANRGTLQEPRWVRQEVEQFSSRHPERPIIPISIGGALQDATLAEQTKQWLKFEDKIWLDEPDEAVAQGIASEELVTRLALAPAGRSSNVKWRWVVRTVIAVLLVLTTVAIGVGIYAQKQKLAAERQASIAESGRLAAQSEIMLPQDQTLAFDMALRGWNTWNSEEARLGVARTFPELEATLPAATNPIGRTFGVTDIACSPDGRLEVIAGEDGMARVWNMSRQSLLATLDDSGKSWFSHSPDGALRVFGSPEPILRVAFSSDGTWIVTATDRSNGGTTGQSTVRVWTTSGQPVSTLAGPIDKVRDARFSADGRQVITMSDDGTVANWDPATGRLVSTQRSVPAFVAHRSPDGQYIAVPSWTGAMPSDTQIGRTDRGQSTVVHGRIRVGSSPFSPDSKRIVTIGGMDSPSNDRQAWLDLEKTARVWDVQSGALLAKLTGHGRAITDASFSPDGNWIVSGSADGTARVWDAASGKVVAILQGNAGRVQQVRGEYRPDQENSLDSVTRAAFSPDGLRVTLGRADGTAQVWVLAIGRVVATLNDPDSRIVSGEFSPDGTGILTLNEAGTAKIWKDTAGKPITLSHQLQSAKSAIFSPDGREILTASDQMRLWNSSSGTLSASFPGGDETTWSPLYSPDGGLILTYSKDRMRVRIRSTPDLKLKATLTHEQPVNDALFSPDSKRVVTAGQDGAARVWDISGGNALAYLKDTVDNDIHESGAYAAAFSPDGQYIVVAGEWNIARVWDGRTDKLLFSLNTAGRWVYRAFYSPDGKRILTDIKDDTETNVQLWTAKGDEVAEVRGNTARGVRSVFSPDGRWFVTSSDLIRVWSTGTGRMIATIKSTGFPETNNTAIFSPTGNLILTTGGGKAAQLWQLVTLRELKEILHN